MVGSPGISTRLVFLVTVAATLLAAWVPPARACACGPVCPANEAVTPDPEPPTTCSCCAKSPSPNEARRPCCLAHSPPKQSGRAEFCECSPWNGPGGSEPTAPPSSVDSDDGRVLTAVVASATADYALAPAGLAPAEKVVHLAEPPSIDLVISLSRITC